MPVYFPLESYYRVVITKKHARVYNKRNKIKLIDTAYAKVHIGDEDTSVLLQLSELEPLNYMFIGERIFTFTALAPIVSFSTPVGNSAVPYPYANDSQGNIYFLMRGEEVVVKANSPTTKKFLNNYEDPYQYLYKITEMVNRDDNQKRLVKPSFKAFYFGDERYTLNYNVNPAQRYDEIMKMLKKEGIEDVFVQRTASKKKRDVLSKTEYVAVVEKWGKRHGLQPIANLKVLHNGLFA